MVLHAGLTLDYLFQVEPRLQFSQYVPEYFYLTPTHHYCKVSSPMTSAILSHHIPLKGTDDNFLLDKPHYCGTHITFSYLYDFEQAFKVPQGDLVDVYIFSAISSCLK